MLQFCTKCRLPSSRHWGLRKGDKSSSDPFHFLPSLSLYCALEKKCPNFLSCQLFGDLNRISGVFFFRLVLLRIVKLPSNSMQVVDLVPVAVFMLVSKLCAWNRYSTTYGIVQSFTMHKYLIFWIANNKVQADQYCGLLQFLICFLVCLQILHPTVPPFNPCVMILIEFRLPWYPFSLQLLTRSH